MQAFLIDTLDGVEQGLPSGANMVATAQEDHLDAPVWAIDLQPIIGFEAVGWADHQVAQSNR